jgi:hypothetical protein
MNKRLIATLAALSVLLSAAAFAAPGEYWEITSKTEMPGMPFAMPATTTKVCIPKGEQNNPERTSGDKSCKMTDVKTVGNKTTWKVRCDHNGEVMTGSGEQTTSPGSYQGKMQFSGKSGGHDVSMSSAFSGKRIGGSCDTEELSRQVNKQIAETCEISDKRAAELPNVGGIYLDKGAMCAGKRQEYCSAVRKNAGSDADTYAALLDYDKRASSIGATAVAKACGIDMTSTTKSVCKTLNGSNYDKLSPYCPAQAKAWREAQRKKECEGRSYTSQEDLKACLSGKNPSHGGRSYTSDESESSSSKSGLSNPAGAAIEGAKKLKGLFGF